MGLNYVVIDIIFGVILTFFVGVGCYKAYYNGTSDHWIDHWIPQTIISGLIIISISVGLGIIDDTNMRIENQLRTQLLLTMTTFLIIITKMIIRLLLPVIQGTHLIMTKKLRL